MPIRELIDTVVSGLQAAADSPAATAASWLSSSMVQLSYFAYNEPSDTIPADIADPAKVFAPDDSYWRCVWGPVTDVDDGNLLYVAGLFAHASHGLQETPYAVAVVNRGTADPDLTGLLVDLYEDATPVPQQPWPGAPGSWIADGSSDALTIVTSLTSDGQTLLEYLSGLAPHGSHEPVILVTGHSLGGCVASMLAPWLVANLPPAKTAWLNPITFAAPTAGNAGFVGDLAAACPLRQVFVNPMDVVPLAWCDVTGIPDIYGGQYRDPAVTAWAAATAVELDVLDYPYAPVPSRTPQLPGEWITLDDPMWGIEWFQEALAQHACANYMLLMGLAPPYAFTPGARRMQRLEGTQRDQLPAGAGQAQLPEAPAVDL